jgi:hypothetical protein
LSVFRGTQGSPLTPPLHPTLHDRQGVRGTACPPHRTGASRHWSNKTDMAQRQRAVSLCGLITPRSLDRNGLSVFRGTQVPF